MDDTRHEPTAEDLKYRRLGFLIILGSGILSVTLITAAIRWLLG